MVSEGQVALPSQFGRYTLIERLALGGMAEVFRAKIVSSHGFEKILVIKRILPHLAADPTFVTMFIDEAKLTAQLTHPKIVQVLDFGDVGGQYFIALEFIDGYDALAVLRAAAQRRIRIPLHLAVFIMAEILDALDCAHGAPDMTGRPMHLVHRDISPSNIFISRHGDVKLGDFGIAHADDRTSKTQAGTLKGKYGYMSPEQVVGGALDGRSDLFAVGIVLAEAFMGRRLFTSRNDLDVLLMVRDGRLDRWDRFGHDSGPELSRIVNRALKRDPEQRYQTAAAFRDDLMDYLFAQKVRVGPADLRAFLLDLFDESKDAALRLQRQGRPLSEPISKASAPVAPAVRIDASEAARVGPQAKATATTSRESGPVASAATGAVTAPMEAGGASLADALDGAALALVDLDQWEADPGAVPRAIGAAGVSQGNPADSSPWSTGIRAAPLTKAGGKFTEHNGEWGTFVSAAPVRPPDSAGDLAVISAMRIFANVSLSGETGLLRFERDKEIKEMFLKAGSPESLNSNVPGDRFGAYLVARGVLRPAELDMALGMLPHFSGKLGDTLVGLGLMRPLDVFRQLSQQVRDRVIDLFRWKQGTFAFFRGVRNEQDGFPLGLDAFEMLGAGVLTLPADDLEERFSAFAEARPRRSDRQRFEPDAFRLGPTPREVLALLNGDRTVADWLSQFSLPEERATFLRSLHLLVETDLVELD